MQYQHANLLSALPPPLKSTFWATTPASVAAHLKTYHAFFREVISIQLSRLACNGPKFACHTTVVPHGVRPTENRNTATDSDTRQVGIYAFHPCGFATHVQDIASRARLGYRYGPPAWRPGRPEHHHTDIGRTTRWTSAWRRAGPSWKNALEPHIAL